jgi:formyl-CoA transferase
VEPTKVPSHRPVPGPDVGDGVTRTDEPVRRPGVKATSVAGPAGGDPGSGPLAGLRVLELGSLIAGPFAGRLLADWGADVLKVESPDRPDPMRNWGQGALRGQQVWWLVQSRNKRLITIDLHTMSGQRQLLDLAADCDVLLENFRPGTLERWNLAPDQLWQRNPNLIIARVSAFGQSGARSRLPGFAAVAEAMSGMRHLNGYPGQTPPRMGLSIGDSLAGLFAFQGILAALYWRDARGGRGQIVDTSLVEACLAMTESVVSEFAASGVVRGPSGAGLSGIAPSNAFQSRDGRYVVIAANQDSVFARLVEVMRQPGLLVDKRFADHRSRGLHQGEIEAIVGEWVGALDADELVEMLDAAGVPNGLVYTAADIAGDRMFYEREALVTVNSEVGDVLMPGIVPKLSATPGAIRWAGRTSPGYDDAASEWLDRSSASESIPPEGEAP